MCLLKHSFVITSYLPQRWLLGQFFEEILLVLWDACISNVCTQLDDSIKLSIIKCNSQFNFVNDHQCFQIYLSTVACLSKKIFFYRNCNIYFNSLKFSVKCRTAITTSQDLNYVDTVCQNYIWWEIIAIVMNLSLLLICIVMQYQLICVIAGLIVLLIV